MQMVEYVNANIVKETTQEQKWKQGANFFYFLGCMLWTWGHVKFMNMEASMGKSYLLLVQSVCTRKWEHRKNAYVNAWKWIFVRLGMYSLHTENSLHRWRSFRHTSPVDTFGDN